MDKAMQAPSALPHIVVVCGPTGIGKTAAAIRLAQALDGEIVGADSMQIYRRMDIGTAKPTPAERAAVPHHMLDVVEPSAAFDAVRYARLAGACIRDIRHRGKVPVVAGGTGLYIKALIHGLFETRPVDRQVRQRLEAMAATQGLAPLYARLMDCDPETAARLHPNDRFRIIRALETFEACGRPMSALQRDHNFMPRRYAAFKIGLEMAREALYARIDRRVAGMIAAGLRDEVQCLLDQGFGPELKAMQSIGYRHMTDFLAGRCDWEETLRLLRRDTRRYAKRQFTWFRADPEIIWTQPEAVDDLLPRIRSFLAPAP
jgi:tRNA dimethylallyltransferase